MGGLVRGSVVLFSVPAVWTPDPVKTVFPL